VKRLVPRPGGTRPQRTLRSVEFLLIAAALKRLINAELQNTMLASKAIAGIEVGKLEIRPGLSNVLKAMSRIAPQFMLNQMANMARPKK
jgi:hypothetical protein